MHQYRAGGRGETPPWGVGCQRSLTARGRACWRRVLRTILAATPATTGASPPRTRYTSSPHSTPCCSHALGRAAHPEGGTQEAADLPSAGHAPSAAPAATPRPRALGRCAPTTLHLWA